MKKLISALCRQPWGQFGMPCEPSDADILNALSRREYEVRGFQQHEAELVAELFRQGQSEKDTCHSVRKYHARRIAYFVDHGWKNPILLSPDGVTVKDGSHRLRAASFKREKEVDCEIEKKA